MESLLWLPKVYAGSTPGDFIAMELRNTLAAYGDHLKIAFGTKLIVAVMLNVGHGLAALQKMVMAPSGWDEPKMGKTWRIVSATS